MYLYAYTLFFIASKAIFLSSFIASDVYFMIKPFFLTAILRISLSLINFSSYFLNICSTQLLFTISIM